MNETDWTSDAICAGAVDRRLRSGQTLFRAGERTVGLYKVIKGKVRLIRLDSSGREAVLQLAVGGDYVAEASLFSAAYHCDAIASTEAVVRLYPKSILLNELNKDRKLMQAFAHALAQQVMTLRTQLERRNIHSARDRIRHFLAVNIGTDGRTVALPGTVKELAAELGLTHEALYRTLARMEADGEIKRSDGVIKIERSI